MGDSESQRGKLQDAIKESRDMQLSTSDMLAKLLQAPDPRQVLVRLLVAASWGPGGGCSGDSSVQRRERRKEMPVLLPAVGGPCSPPTAALQVAQQHVESLTEEFFWTANTYLSMVREAGLQLPLTALLESGTVRIKHPSTPHPRALPSTRPATTNPPDHQPHTPPHPSREQAQKEGNTTVTQHIESALKAALEAKQATLRVEIQLLNRLLGAETQEARQRVGWDGVGCGGWVGGGRGSDRVVIQGGLGGLPVPAREGHKGGSTLGHQVHCLTPHLPL